MSDREALFRNIKQINGYLQRDDGWESRLAPAGVATVLSKTAGVVADFDKDPDAERDVCAYLLCILRFAARLRDRVDLNATLPATVAAAFAERVAGSADDADQPSEAYATALSLHPSDDALLRGLVRWIVEGRYACENAFARVARVDPERAQIWIARQLATDFFVSAEVEARDTALLWLAEAMGRAGLDGAQVRSEADVLCSLAGEAWMVPTAEEWETVSDLV